MADTFAPPIGPAPGSGKVRTERLHEAEFGDGYSERIQAGINSDGEERRLVWPVLTHAQADLIEVFFNAHTAEGFDYAPPPDSVTKRWRIKGGTWTRNEPEPLQSAIEVTFKRVWDLD